jgi:AraC-like DNA-binding protein
MSIITGAEFWNIIICLGALQGFILSILLFLSKKGNKLSNRLLAVLIFLLALTSTNLYIIESDFYDEYALVQILQQVLPLVITLPVGPLIYFYVRSLSQADFQLHKKQWWHFSPVIIDLIPRMIVWVFIIGLLTGIVQEEDGRGWGDFIDTYNTYSDLPRWLSITLYLLLTKHFLKKCIAAKDGEVDAQTSTQEKMNWIHQFLNAFLAFQFIWLLFLIPYLIPSTRGYLLDNMSYYPIYIPLAVLVYWLGFKGYLQTQLSKTEPIVKDFPIQPGPLKVVNPSLSFSDEEVTHYTTLLKKSMEEDKLYLESSLNLQSVSTHTNIAQKTISYILNNYHNKSFNEFVNEYRIQEVKKRLLEKDKDHLTIYGIALDCGFNSQATFQRAFKSITGVSPKEYLSIQSRKLA